MTIRNKLVSHVEAALRALVEEGYLQGEMPSVVLTPAKQATFGDFACTVALNVAKAARKNPREIAEKLRQKLGDASGMLAKTEVAGAGFLNLFVTDQAWREALEDILKRGASYLKSNVGQGQRVLLEYVSANPTGPLHVAHGRGAVTGDIMARLLKTAGFNLDREYYINDMGNQTEVMARSVHLRYGEVFGRSFVPPEDFYPGEYITDIAQALAKEVGDRYVDASESEWLEIFRRRGIEFMMKRIKDDLHAFGIDFDAWVSERELATPELLQDVVQRLERAGHVYVEEGKKWFRSTTFGDDKDRVVIREDGRPTYFASDIAYHDHKLQRGYKKLINVWGADHGGYIARVRAGLAALGHDPAALDVVFIQMVSLSREGEAVRMGKRLGTAVWLKDVIDAAGKDATRYFFVMRRSDAQLDFDLDLAMKKSIDNPVYYAQMGHARMASIARKAGYKPPHEKGILDALTLPEEISLIKSLVAAPELIALAAVNYEPHQVVHYLQDLIAQFHSYYTRYKATERVISSDVQKTHARLLLCEALQTILRALLEDILGVGAPEQMYLPEEENAT